MIIFTMISIMILLTFSTNNSVSASSSDVFDAEVTELGFSMNDHYQPILLFGDYFKRIEGEKEWTNGDYAVQVEIDHTIVYDDRDTENYAFIYRFIINPGVGKRSCGFLWRSTCYDRTVYSDVVHVESDLPDTWDLKNWQPQTGVENYTNTIGIGGGSSGFDLGFTHSWSFSDIDVYAPVDTYTEKYHAVYNFITKSTYTKNASMHYGMFTFDKSHTGSLWIEYDFYVHWTTNFGAVKIGNVNVYRGYYLNE